jgi:membrane protein implicated in regulation of membrane protease activity
MTELIRSMGELNAWSWLILGALLCVLEAIIPGVYIVWFGVGAACVGLLLFAVPHLLWQWQMIVFVVASCLSLFAGRMIMRRTSLAKSDHPLLNKRAQQLIGQVHVLEQPIAEGRGKLKVGDGYWIISGPDAPVGSRVRITGSEGATLLVEPLTTG